MWPSKAPSAVVGGGASIVRHLPSETASRFDPRWVLSDPKEDRAARLAGLVKERFPFTEPQALALPARDAATRAGDDAALVLALDSVDNMRELLPMVRARQPVAFQLVGRGPGGHAGVRAAFNGTVLPGDAETKDQALMYRSSS